MEGTRYQGKPRRQWIKNIEDWMGYKYIQLKEMSMDREQWRKKTREWSAAVANPRRRKAERDRERDDRNVTSVLSSDYTDENH